MADVSLDLSGIKPLLGQLGLGQAPAAAPAVDQRPTPPMPPPPTPAQAGFTAYSSDPRNQQTIANSLTMPGTPITPPNVPPASPLSGDPTPPPAAPSLKPFNPMASIQPMASPALTQTIPSALSKPAPLTVNPYGTPTQAEDMAANPSQYERPMLKKAGFLGNLLNFSAAGLAGAAGGLGNKNPLAGIDWVQQQAANDRGVNAANAAQYDARNIKPLKDAAALADTQSQTALRTAQGNKADTQADAFTPQTLTRDQAIAINQPDLAGTQMSSRDYAKLVGSAGNNNTSAGNNAATNATKVTTNAATNTTRTATNAATNTARTAISDAANKTRTLVAQMHDSTSRANNENTVSSKVGGPASGGGFKVPADVTKRAALGSNVLENADAVEGIINKRPDIIGAAGGRYSNVQQMIGSDDPDIQALGVRMHNIALASNGAHGVRAQQAIQKTEDELFGNFKAGPNAIKGALGATRASMQTFLNDENNFATTGKRTGGGTAATPASSPGTSDGAVKVQIPGQPAGTIHASQLAAFKAKYPNAKVIQ